MYDSVRTLGLKIVSEMPYFRSRVSRVADPNKTDIIWINMIYIYTYNVINMILVSKMRKSQTTVSIYLINMSNFGGLRTPIVWTGPSQNATPPAPHFWIGFPPEVALISVCNWSRSAEQPRLVDPNGGSASSFEFPRRSSISSNDNGAACLWFV